jgi:hypothetical protein
MLLFLSFSHSWIVLYLPLGSQHIKVKHLAFSFSIGRCIILPLWHFPLRLSPGKAREKNKTAKLFPLLHTSLTWEDSLQHALAFYLSIYFIPFWFRVVDIGLLTLEPSTFARKKGGSKTLILDTLYIYHTSFRSSRFLSVSRIVDFWILISSLSLPITWFNLRIVGFLLLMDSFVRH